MVLLLKILKFTIHLKSIESSLTKFLLLLLFNFVCLIWRKVIRTHSESPTVTIIYFTLHEVYIGTSSLLIDAYKFNRVCPNLKYKNFRFQGNYLHIFLYLYRITLWGTVQMNFQRIFDGNWTSKFLGKNIGMIFFK